MKEIYLPLAPRYFEFVLVELTLRHNNSSRNVHMGVLYRPPAASQNFLAEIEELFDYLIRFDEIILVGHFNLHVDKINDRNAVLFLKLLKEYGWSQHINEVTHETGHALDLLITKKISRLQVK